MEEAVLCVMLAANSIQDLRKRSILLIPTIGTGIWGLCRLIMSGTPAAVFIPALITGAALMLVSCFSGERLGYGDSLTVLVMGTWTGAAGVAASLFLALVFVTAAFAAVRTVRKPEKEWPFIPFIFAGYLAQLSLSKLLF